METVIVHRKTVYNRHGVMELIATPDKIYGVTCRLEGGRVRTTSGDVWKVVRLNNGEATYRVSEPVG